MKVVKAEVLWSRSCPLDCAYCGMKNETKNTVPIEMWKRGIDNLKALGCEFIAFYGAEPLYTYSSASRLGKVIEYAEQSGIKTTVITSGIVPKQDYLDADLKTKIEYLYKCRLRSLTVSVDPNPTDKSSIAKSKKGYELLLWARKKFPKWRDLATVSTLTALNFTKFPNLVIKNDRNGFWSFFDIVHWDRGQAGTKCRNFPGDSQYRFTEENICQFKTMLLNLMDLKDNGSLLHTSRIFMGHLLSQPQSIINPSWNCAIKGGVYPSWLTIDADGEVLPCDDFNPNIPEPFWVWEIANRFDAFKAATADIVWEKCPGCLWNTHMDADAIKCGVIPFRDYIHEEEV